MQIKERLSIIKHVSELTQEKLAARLGVSFVTLNNWINGKSIPHAKKQALIDELYKKYTGQTIIPKNILLAKKSLLQKRAKSVKNVLKKMTSHKDIYDEFLLLLTYHTNSIEGSTLNQNETSAILFFDKVLPNKSLVEQMEVKNHQATFEYLLKHLGKSKKIDEDLILKLHAILMNGIRDDAGFYRRYGVRIVGANVPTSNYVKIPDLMEELIKKINRSRKDSIKHIAEIHSAFEKIHPFGDGNGRIGRLILNGMLIINHMPPAIIRQENKQLYYTYLNKAQTEDDSSLLEDFLCDAIEEGLSILSPND